MKKPKKTPDSQRPRKHRVVLPSPGPRRLDPLRGDQVPFGDQQKQVQDLIDILKRNQLTELEWECDTFRVRLRHDAEPRSAASSSAEYPRPLHAPPPDLHGQADSADKEGLVTITSPIVGTFYRSPAPDADAYVEENDFVKKGQVLCIVEAMKLMNEIESEVDGRVVRILAESTNAVEYGQPLFLIDPSAAA